MPEVQVLRVFVTGEGAGGNPLGVVLDAVDIDAGHRQAIAAELGYSETIFVEPGARIGVFTPTTELPFAGHPLVGAAWILRAPVLHPPAGPVAARADAEHGWILADPAFSPAWDRRQLSSPAEVDAFVAPQSGHLQVWAWQDESGGRIRARVFGPDYGVPEDPATGSATILLCAELGRTIVVDQGPGSEIVARPADDGQVELGGIVVQHGALSL